MATDRVKIEIGARCIDVEKGANLMEALVAAGIMLRSDCRGRGRCDKCRVRFENPGFDRVSAPGEQERNVLGENDLQSGLRLSCCTRVFDHIALMIPEGSRATAEVVQKKLPTLLARLKTPASYKLPAASPPFGLAVDVGTTTIAAFLCDIATAPCWDRHRPGALRPFSATM